MVGYDAWHELFADPEHALECFAFGLSSTCRLRVHSRGSFEYKWTVEVKHGEAWVEDSTTGLIFYPFWRREQIRYRCNTVINDEQ